MVQLLKLQKRVLHLGLDRAVYHRAIVILEPLSGIGAVGKENAVRSGKGAENVLCQADSVSIVLAVSIGIVFHKGLRHSGELVHGSGLFQAQFFEPILADPQNRYTVQARGGVVGQSHQLTVEIRRLEYDIVQRADLFRQVGGVLIKSVVQGGNALLFGIHQAL